ncbi:HAD family hydrolase [Orenia marismortui]|uniref:HAD family hydrolase n=1 Tax=Orenia marismortui TaxID=46469 RepID=UPI00058FE6DF|nr:HAD family hydrolase [Orenia marismortui]
MQNQNTALFDLDGTLLRIDFEEFLKNYFKALTAEFHDLLRDSDKFIKILMKSTEEMIKNDGRRTNQEVFMDSFFSLLDVQNTELVSSRIEYFYKNKFSLLGEGFSENKDAIKIIKKLKKAGYRLAITTNPLFPKTAVLERIKWVGLKVKDFELITSYENMHYAKPNLKYYQEVINKMKVKADQCIMVGNDLQEDMIAGQLGVKTFLIDDYLIDRKDGSSIKVDWRGSLKEFRDIIERID